MSKLFIKIRRKIGVMGFALAVHLPQYFSYKHKIVGKMARKIRAHFAKKFCKHIGKSVNIQKGVKISNGLSLGDYSGIGAYSDVQGDITIGNNVMMGPECIFYTNGHRTDRVDIPMNLQGMTESKPIVVGDDVWIGSRVIILPGVHIGNGSVIGAGSVVTKDVPEYVLCAGNPAVVKKNRKESIVN